jgi:hypothetical protein
MGHQQPSGWRRRATASPSAPDIAPQRAALRENSTLHGVIFEKKQIPFFQHPPGCGAPCPKGRVGPWSRSAGA